jgi:hypothetical protein
MEARGRPGVAEGRPLLVRGGRLPQPTRRRSGAQATAWALAVMIGAGCGRCQERVPDPNAGGADTGAQGSTLSASADAGAPGAVPASVDLKSALTLVYPEFRWATLRLGRAALVRRYPGALPREQVAAALEAQGSEPLEARGEQLEVLRSPFEVTASASPGGGWELSAAVPIRDEDLGRVLYAKAPLSTDVLRGQLPPLGLGWDSERFELTVRYEANPARASFLVWQLVDSLVGSGWRTEPALERWPKPSPKGVGGPKDPLQLVLQQVGSGGSIELRRAGGVVDLHYRQLLAPRPASPGD